MKKPGKTDPFAYYPLDPKNLDRRRHKSSTKDANEIVSRRKVIAKRKK